MTPAASRSLTDSASRYKAKYLLAAWVRSLCVSSLNRATTRCNSGAGSPEPDTAVQHRECPQGLHLVDAQILSAHKRLHRRTICLCFTVALQWRSDAARSEHSEQRRRSLREGWVHNCAGNYSQRSGCESERHCSVAYRGAPSCVNTALKSSSRLTAGAAAGSRGVGAACSAVRSRQKIRPINTIYADNPTACTDQLSALLPPSGLCGR